MSKTVRKIIAIGGGENGRINSKGEKLPYELSEIDSEITAGICSPQLVSL